MTDYQDFLKSKVRKPVARGFEATDFNDLLHPFQRDIVKWACGLGKAAIFAAVGLGKTFMQLEWASQVVQHTGGKVLILAPLAVSHQTIREGAKFGYTVEYVTDQDAVDNARASILITNYERVERFDHSQWQGVVLDESSILKNFTGKIKRGILTAFEATPYKLACSATPAPNDQMELGNHSDFLDIMPSNEMLARWFINDTMTAGKYRLKSHGKSDFWRWLTSWAVCITKPSDLGDGYDDDGYVLPPLNIVGHHVGVNQQAIDKAWENGRLFPDIAPSSTELGRVKRMSLDDRVTVCQQIVNEIPEGEAILIWCNLNDEQDALEAVFPTALSVRGSDKPEEKTRKLLAFSAGENPMLITKASIAGFGMNWQHCHEPIFLGLDFSFESFYQAIGRNYRYGQKNQVNAHIIHAETEGNVVQTLYRKQSQFEEMQDEMAQAMRTYGLFRNDNRRELTMPENDEAKGRNWTMLLGDCVERTEELEDNSIDFCIHSPPFANLYIYSDSEADMGNASDDDEFFEHYKYLISELLRVTAPGRLCAVHCKDLPAYMNRDGYAGLRDFPGEIIRAFQDCGWAYHARFTIWKDPVIEMQRTKNHGLLHKNFVKESNACRQGMPDYMVVFRKYPLDGQIPVTQSRVPGDYIGTNPPPEHLESTSFQNGAVSRNDYSIAVWQRYASPVWFDIDQTNVLNYRIAKSNEDEKHICPLQLDVISRCIDLWTNEGDVVFSPFAGIGSEGYESIRMGRKFIGVELKREYWKQACKYLQEAEMLADQPKLF